MIFDLPFRVPVDEVEDEKGLPGPDADPRLLEEFPLGRLANRLPQLDQAARDGPEALARGACPLHEQDAPLADHDGAHPHAGKLPVLTPRLSALVMHVVPVRP